MRQARAGGLCRLRPNMIVGYVGLSKFMSSHQEQYDDAMFAFSTGDYDGAIAGLQALLGQDPGYFEAQLALGMAFYRKGDYPRAIAEGHKAEQMRPKEQLVHTNLSLFYMKAGDKKTAEHHGLQARISSWKADKSAPGDRPPESELEMAKPPAPPVKAPEKFPDMPWKKKHAPSGDSGKVT
jgi:predicted Zn-dependent protease